MLENQNPFLDGTSLMQRRWRQTQADVAAAIDLSREEFRNPGPLLVNDDDDDQGDA